MNKVLAIIIVFATLSGLQTKASATLQSIHFNDTTVSIEQFEPNTANTTGLALGAAAPANTAFGATNDIDLASTAEFPHMNEPALIYLFFASLFVFGVARLGEGLVSYARRHRTKRPTAPQQAGLRFSGTLPAPDPF